MFKDFRKFYLGMHPRKGILMDDIVKGQSIVPAIVRESSSNMITDNVFSYLLENRIIYMGEEFNPDTCNIIVAQLLYLNQVDPDKDINIYINSPGGSVTDLFAVLNTMNAIGNDVGTVCVGLAASCANLLLVSGAPGKRAALPLSKLLTHQPMGGARGQASDIVIEANFISELKEDIAQIYMKHCGISHDEIWEKMDRDLWIRPENALPGKFGTLGQIDKVIDKI